MPSLLELIQIDRNGALSKIYQEYRVEFISWATKHYGCSTDEAKDCYQNAIIILYENIVSGKLKELNSTTKTYLFAIGKNKIRELKRQENRKESLNAEVDSVAEESVEEYPAEAIQLALQSIDKLGEPCRTLLQEFYFHKSTMQQIMIKLGYKNEDTTKNQKYKCLMRLRKIYHELHVKTA